MKVSIFWKNGKKISIHTFLLKRCLKELGFGQFQTDSKRTSGKETFRNNNGVLEIHDKNSIKRYVEDWLDSFSEEDFMQGGIFDTTTPDLPSAEKYEVLETWSKYSPSTLETTILNSIELFSQEGFKDTKKLFLFPLLSS